MPAWGVRFAPSRRRVTVVLFGVAGLVVPGWVTTAPIASATSAPACGPAMPDVSSVVVTCAAIGGEQAFTVPDGVTRVRVRAVGGTGGKSGDVSGQETKGEGAVVTAEVPVRPGTTLYVLVGGNGAGWGPSSTTAGNPGGFNGGGPGGGGPSVFRNGGGGGGASDIRTCSITPGQSDSCSDGALGTAADPRLVVAAGGGGVNGAGGGAGGTPDGAPGGLGFPALPCYTRPTGGGGATQTAPGAGGVPSQRIPNCVGKSSNGGFGGSPGTAGAGGAGGDAMADSVATYNAGGGGGGGYFGGGGGAGGFPGAGGGGGSSFAPPSASSVEFGLDTTATPSVTITYARPGAVVAGSTWYSDGTKTQAGSPGALIAAYAVGALQNVPYHLVLGTGDATHACTTVLQVLNQTIVYAGPSGLIGRVSGTLQPGLAAGTYKLCFEDSSSGNVTGTGGATFTVQ